MMTSIAKYGDKPFKFYQALYRELCDEMRREAFSKPPVPYLDWTVDYERGRGWVAFKKPAAGPLKLPVEVYAPLFLGDPKKMNEKIEFLIWYPMEVFVRKSNLVIHISVAGFEANMHFRNMAIYDDPEGKTIGMSLEAQHERKIVRYNGPWSLHLEEDVMCELWDTTMDFTIDPKWARFSSEYVYYCEHVEYLRWLRHLMDLAIPGGPESETELISAEEMEANETSNEVWLPAKTI